jgi:A/G-specific adenine glycosylase
MRFSRKLLAWYQQHGRHELPWQKRPTPYRVWISEIMLQQTQVTTVIPYFQRFVRSFPNLKSLALADADQVLAHWSGLGYYARARNIHKTAKIIYHHCHGRFPRELDALIKLPGIGKSTAGAIASFAMNQPTAILDGNVKRVITRYYAIEGWPGKTEVNRQLWQTVEKVTPKKNTQAYNQAIMDLGSIICTRTKPQCPACPISSGCQAYLQQRTADFPYRKKAKARPTKPVYALLLRRDDGAFLLEKRPPVGIWGGLWAFPECAIDDSIEDHCQHHYALQILSNTPWDVISHQFSHFQLEIHPLLLNVHSKKRQVMDSDRYIWYKLSDSTPGGIPTPVRKLFNKLEEAYEPHDLM